MFHACEMPRVWNSYYSTRVKYYSTRVKCYFTRCEMLLHAVWNATPRVLHGILHAWSAYLHYMLRETCSTQTRECRVSLRRCSYTRVVLKLWLSGSYCIKGCTFCILYPFVIKIVTDCLKHSATVQSVWFENYTYSYIAKVFIWLKSALWWLFGHRYCY